MHRVPIDSRHLENKFRRLDVLKIGEVRDEFSRVTG